MFLEYYIYYFLLPMNLISLCAAENNTALYKDVKLNIGNGSDLEDLIIKTVNDTLELDCTVQGYDNSFPSKSHIVWTYPLWKSNRSHLIVASASGRSSRLTLQRLQLSDAGHYMCQLPSNVVASKLVAVRRPVPDRLPPFCGRSMYYCGKKANHCINMGSVCDGHLDCRDGDDETIATCGTPTPCYNKLSCHDGRCISALQCCNRKLEPHCLRPSCCGEHHHEEEPETNFYYPNEKDSQAHDFGILQTTVYTVTACALIFMIAIVLLISAICKMHIKRTVLQNYAAASALAHQRQYNLPTTPAPRYPGLHNCIENDRLLATEYLDCPNSPQRSGGCATELPSTDDENSNDTTHRPTRPSDFGIGRSLTDVIFNNRYRAPSDVEMTTITRTRSPCNSPRRIPLPTEYRSPAYCGDGGDYYFDSEYGPNINFDLEERRPANAVARILDRFGFNGSSSYRVEAMEQNFGAPFYEEPVERRNESRSLSFRLGRLQISLPRFGNGGSATRNAIDGRRPDTPNVAEIDLDDVDFVRFNFDDNTYTLNGRTIRLGANFENCQGLSIASRDGFVGRIVSPPPYSEAVSLAPSKVYGPPPSYVSCENLTAGPTENVRNNSDSANNNLTNNEHIAFVDADPTPEITTDRNISESHDLNGNENSLTIEITNDSNGNCAVTSITNDSCAVQSTTNSNVSTNVTNGGNVTNNIIIVPTNMELPPRYEDVTSNQISIASNTNV